MRFLLAILVLLIAAPAWAQQGQGMSQAVVVSSCGSGALPSGALNQLTMDPQGRLCQSGIGSNVCSQATAYLARTTGGNEGGNAVAITALICGLVTDGVIDGTMAGTTTCGTHLDGLYILAQQNAADAILNLCGTSYSIIPSTATFTAYRGYSAFATAGASTGFNGAVSPGRNFGQNSATLGAWAYDAPDGFVQIGTSLNAGTSLLLANYSSTFTCGVNSANSTSVATKGIGLYSCDRPSSSTINYFWDGASQGSFAVAAASPESAFMTVGGFTSTAGWATAKTISEAHFGASLGATLQLALYTRLRTYMTAVGVP